MLPRHLAHQDFLCPETSQQTKTEIAMLTKVTGSEWQEMIGLVLHNRGNEEHMRNTKQALTPLPSREVLAVPSESISFHTTAQWGGRSLIRAAKDAAKET